MTPWDLGGRAEQRCAGALRGSAGHHSAPNLCPEHEFLQGDHQCEKSAAKVWNARTGYSGAAAGSAAPR